MADQSAATGKESPGAMTPRTTSGISVLDALPTLTECRRALERRKHRALTPYDADAWEKYLTQAELFERYVHIPPGLHKGFNLNFPIITVTQTPPNKESIVVYTKEFQSIIESEIQKERYIGPCTATSIENLIGPFQSSPLSIIPKPG